MGEMMIPDDHGTRKRKQPGLELGFRRRKVAKRNPPAFTVVKKYQLGLGSASSDSSSSTESYCSTATSRPPPPVSGEAEEEVQQEIKKVNSFRPKPKEEDEEASGDDADDDTQNWLLLHYIRSDSTFIQQKLLTFKPIMTPRWIVAAVIFVDFIFIPIGRFSFICPKCVVEIVIHRYIITHGDQGLPKHCET